MPQDPENPATEHPTPGRGRVLLVYGLLLLAAVGLFLLIRSYGETLPAPPPGSGKPRVRAPGARGDVLFHVLLALATVVALGRALGRLFAYLGQPPVIGEVIAGILLGPSLLGRIAPEVAQYILPPDAAPYLGVIAQLGVLLYMFLVGLELNGEMLRRRAHATVVIAHTSIVVPFVLGAVLALALYSRLAPGGVPFTSFALFMGVAMSVTAFPVLARILTDRKISRTELGVVAMTCAAVDDVTAWCLLALVVSVAQAHADQALQVAGLTAVYIAFMFLAVRPVATRVAARYDRDDLPQGVVALVLVALLLSCVTTELIGIHALFGAFLLGAVIPPDSAIARVFTRKLEDLVTVLLLPAFFAFTGMRTEIGLVSGPGEWLACGLILLVATAGKFGGTLAAARFTGLGWRTSASLGVLMNTRGLMELIVLNIGLDLGVISPTLFAMMVLMALVTTMATTTVLHVLVESRPKSRMPP